jgi:hypothetical protein
MKQYLLRLDNNMYVIVFSAIDYQVGDRYEHGTIVQVGIQIREYGQHYNISKSLTKIDDVYKHALNLG